MVHIPILRAGEPYQSLDTYSLHDQLTGAEICTVSMANRGLIAKDMNSYSERQNLLNDIPILDALKMCHTAATLFAEGDLPLGDQMQSAQDYVRQLSSTTGLPQNLCWLNSKKIQGALEQMETILHGMTRSSDLNFLDSEDMVSNNISFIREADSLGAVLPNNSPGVHTLWLPAIPLRVPLSIRPGSREPWTAYRIIQAFIRAGIPQEVFGYYP
jgi:acyl-CoA reductase-like NAD-dependent aldehyde dehydrogenase